MNKKDLIEQYKKAGESWLDGADITEWDLKGKHIKLNPKQIEFLNSKKKFVCFSGGMACGKSLAMIMKMVLHCLFFPNARVLLGRLHLSDLEKSTLPDLFELIPESWYQYHTSRSRFRVRSIWRYQHCW